MVGDGDTITLRDPRAHAVGEPLRAASDVGVLQRVLVHRPGGELARVTAATAEGFLFDGPVPLRRAQRDHDALCEALGSGGARVEGFEPVLRRALASAHARERVVGRLAPSHRAASLLLELDAAGLARALVAGVTEAELERAARGPDGSERRRWVVPPLPNLIFTRDLFTVIAGGVARGDMRREARSGEACLADVVIETLGARSWWARGGGPVEGGDVLLAGPGVVVVGIGERTSHAGAARLARRLLDGGAAREVIGALVPPGGPFHLDLAISLVDEGTLLAHRPTVDAIRTIRWRAGRPAAAGGDLVGALAAALGSPLTVIPTLPEQHERTWDRGANVVAIRPGTVVAYADNRATNRRLERAGVEVLPVPGDTLGRGRGGPRCLTAPLARA